MQELLEFAKIFEEKIEKERVYSKEEIERIKRKIAKQLGIKVPKNTELITLIKNPRVKNLLITKPIRSISGVNVLTVVAPSFFCPGECIYCPSFKNIPKSYTPNEPAIQRALRNDYDPFLQTKDRLKQFELLGQLKKGAKIEIIILGGTFLALEKSFKEWFVKRIFDALNQKEAKNLEEAHLINETSDYRCVNLTMETRPDFCFEDHVDEMLYYGTTRVEIGVQSIYDEVLKFVKRNHTVEDVIKATKIARNAGLKICYHIMPNLPKSDLDRDLEMFRELFENPNFRPDYLKIYPLQLFKNTELFKLYEKGEFRLYSEEELIELLAKAKKFFPEYVRIQRLGRDIPLNDVDVAYLHTNLRQLVSKRAKELGIFCKCIRCREVGFRIKQGIIPDFKKIKLIKREYEANGGIEIFLSFEDLKTDTIFGFLRLRIPDESHRKEIDERSAIIRELKVLGFQVPIGNLPKEFNFQHRGLGKKLMEEAERIALEEFDKTKMVVISAVGTRNYYRKLGYEREGPYMVKELR